MPHNEDGDDDGQNAPADIDDSEIAQGRIEFHLMFLRS